jgi:hypothetical protein
MDIEFSGLDFRDVEKIVDELHQSARGVDDEAYLLELLLGEITVDAIEQKPA